MKSIFWLLMALLVSVRVAAAAGYAALQGPRQVAELRDVWKDSARNREVPVLICYPKDLGIGKNVGETVPVIVFSHGLGGTRESYEAYGTFWASYGYVVIFPQHHGSDVGVVGHGMLAMLMGMNDVVPFLDRVRDVHFVIDQVELMNAGKVKGSGYGMFAGHLDLEKIGMAGHSFGAITTEAIVGEQYSLDAERKMIDSRGRAGLVMSGSGSKDPDQGKAFGSIQVPVFYMTGTEDKMGNIGAKDRRTAFDFSTFKETFLVTFAGATHMTFVPRVLASKEQEAYQFFIRESTTAFWDAYLKGDEKAKAWLKGDFAKELGAGGVFEKK
jgi:predicted dienelactone hydrolase